MGGGECPGTESNCLHTDFQSLATLWRLTRVTGPHPIHPHNGMAPHVPASRPAVCNGTSL